MPDFDKKPWSTIVDVMRDDILPILLILVVALVAIRLARLSVRGVVKALVTTAVPVSDDFKNRLTVKLEAVSGKKIDMVHRIDRAIIGGIIVQLDYQIIDRSIRYELESLRHELMTIKVY